MLYAIVMAGGAGTRFWPASRARFPKQLLPLASDRTMIQATIDRLRGLVPPERILIVTNEALLPAMAKQLPELPPQSFLGEPCKRDTAPCIGLAAGLVRRQSPDATLLVLPADHVIRSVDRFQAAVGQAVDLVQSDPQRLVTFGIRPTYPAESFGYIERGEECSAGVYVVRMFREKPKLPQAREFLAAGTFYWNSGIFVWKAATIEEALSRNEPEIQQHVSRIVAAADTPRFPTVFREEFAAIRGKSIDYAVLEKYPRVAVIEAPFDWDDVGSWQAMARQRGTDPDGNTIVGKHLGLRTRGCIVQSDDQHLVVTLGMEDCIVVHTPDATFVARKQDEEAVRNIVEMLKERSWDEYL